MAKFKFNLKTLWYCLLLIWVVPVSGIVLVGKYGKDFSDLGSFGDFFAGTTVPLLTFISFLAIVITLRMQREQLEMQSEELKNSIEEMKATRKEFEEQNKTMTIQRFENTFFQMVNLHNDIVEAITMGGTDNSKSGRNAFPLIYRYFSNIYASQLSNGNLDDKEEIERIREVYTRMFMDNEQQLGHYFRNLYRIIKFIDESEIEDKMTYIGIIKAQLSSNELALLLYNGLSTFGGKFLPLMRRYNILDNINIEILISSTHYSMFWELE